MHFCQQIDLLMIKRRVKIKSLYIENDITDARKISPQFTAYLTQFISLSVTISVLNDIIAVKLRLNNWQKNILCDLQYE